MHPQQQQQQQQQQGYQPGAPNPGQPGHGHKSGGAFESMMSQMNQAVTTGKPMFNKLGKTISSKLSGKPAAGGPPQHLQSYQNYQEHQSQGQGQQSQAHVFQQQQSQTYSPQPHQQQQWQPQTQPQQQQQPPPPPQPQQSQQQQPQQQWQPQAQPQPQQQQLPQQPQQQQHQPQPQTQPPNAYIPPHQSPFQQTSNYTTPASGLPSQNNYFPQQNFPQSSAPLPDAPSPGIGGNSGMTPQGNFQGQYQQDQQSQGQYSGQQMGVVGAGPSPGYPQNTHAPPMADVSPVLPPANPAGQSAWAYPPASELVPPGATQQVYQALPSPPIPNAQQQQWGAISPIAPSGHSPIPYSSVSPPPQQMYAQPQVAPKVPSHPAQPSTPVPQQTAPPSAPTEFIAELPADLGNLNLHDTKSQVPSPTAQTAQYQAYQPAGTQGGSPSNRFAVPRRAMSLSSLPLADPWRFADPITEQPTREFYILADLLFDALDRNCEPRNSGLLEGPKILKSWVEMTADARGLFSYNNYKALAMLWSLEGIPHVMVPVQPALAPTWYFNHHSHAQDIKVVDEPPTDDSTYASYMPALNRAGWYKFFFLEIMHAPDDIGKLMPALCADTYKPGVLNHPDLNKRDRSELAGLHARAVVIETIAIERVCRETAATMMR
ncbi:hypothetical protein GQ44DRAFT_726529 [Phaeosphaeriaceae sp. PMI808]|nr:hypothetical protein GQ44DRAFT_726529 [Phaeosphaeriaceae sp. PMI808]